MKFYLIFLFTFLLSSSYETKEKTIGSPGSYNLKIIVETDPKKKTEEIGFQHLIKEPREIKSSLELDKVIDFMKTISDLMKKPIILTGENQLDFPLITIDSQNNIFKFLTKNEAMKFWKK
jgi:hypothetical protein